MTGALIILAVTVATGLVLWLHHRFVSRGAGDETGSPEAADGGKEESEECCGLHAVCEKQAAALAAPDYFDDEELDRFAGREPEAYSAEETEEFRQVLYTLLPADVYAWGLSLTKRNIALPTVLRDEWIMLCADNDNKK